MGRYYTPSIASVNLGPNRCAPTLPFYTTMAQMCWMWKAKLKIRHDCIFDDRCRKYKVEVSVTSFNPFKKRGYYYTYHFGTVMGDRTNEFLINIKKDKRVDYVEMEGNTFFIIEKRAKRETPAVFYSPELIYIKPVFVDKTGYETWELASFNKATITDFAKKIRECKIVSIQKTKLKDIYFPRLSPDLSPHQRKALSLAMQTGYYDFPKKIDLNQLAKISKVSRATFREHLRKAEKKILGEFSR